MTGGNKVDNLYWLLTEHNTAITIIERAYEEARKRLIGRQIYEIVKYNNRGYKFSENMRSRHEREASELEDRYTSGFFWIHEVYTHEQKSMEKAD